MARFAEEAGMELDRMNARLRVTFYDAVFANAGDLSVELDRVVVDGFRAACEAARDWMRTDTHRRVSISKSQGLAFRDGEIPDVIVRGYLPGHDEEDVVAVIEVDYADVTE